MHNKKDYPPVPRHNEQTLPITYNRIGGSGFHIVLILHISIGMWHCMDDNNNGITADDLYYNPIMAIYLRNIIYIDQCLFNLNLYQFS